LSSVPPFFFIFLICSVIGACGWAKELLVSFSVILALALLIVLETYVPFYPFHGPTTDPNEMKAEFWTRTFILTMLVAPTPNLPSLAARFVRAPARHFMGLVLAVMNT
jgi:hypothetical protein